MRISLRDGLRTINTSDPGSLCTPIKLECVENLCIAKCFIC